MNGIEMAGWLAPVLGKGAVLLILGFGFAAVLGKRQSATGRRILWSMVMTGLVLLAGLEVMTPKWRLFQRSETESRELEPAPELLPEIETAAFVAAAFPETEADPNPPAFAGPIAPAAPVRFEPTLLDRRSDPVESESRPASTIPPAASDFSLRTASAWLLTAWLTGVVLLTGRFVFSRLALRKLERGARKPGVSWPLLADHISARLGLSKTPRLLVSPQATVPMAWGIFRPRILLPESADELDAASRRYLLQHEISHIAHRDPLSLFVAQAAAILHWPNPLVWLAMRRLRLAQEHACDNAAMADGSAAADYAELLIAIAKRGRETVWSPASVALTMANGSPLNQRINAILDPDMKRNPPGKIETLLTLAMISALTLGLTGIALSDGKKKTGADAGALTPVESPAGAPGTVDLIPPFPSPEGTAVNTESAPVPLQSPVNDPFGSERTLRNSRQAEVLLKLVKVLPGSVDIDTARAIADDLSKQNQEAARQLIEGSATISMTVGGNQTMSLMVTETEGKRRLFSQVYSLRINSAKSDPFGTVESNASRTPRPATLQGEGVPLLSEMPQIGRLFSRNGEPGSGPLPKGAGGRGGGISSLERKLQSITIREVDFVETPFADAVEWLEFECLDGGDDVNILLLREARDRVEAPKRELARFNRQYEQQALRVENTRATYLEHSARMEALREQAAAGIDAGISERRAAARSDLAALKKRWSSLKDEDAAAVGAIALQENPDCGLAKACEAFHDTQKTMEARAQTDTNYTRAEGLRQIAEALERLETAAERYLNRVREDLAAAEKLADRVEAEINEAEARAVAAIESGVAGLELEQAKQDFQAALRDLQGIKRQAESFTTADGDSAEPRITLQLENVPLGEVLRYAVQLAGLAYEVQPHAVVIGTREEIDAMSAGRAPAPKGASIEAFRELFGGDALSLEPTAPAVAVRPTKR